MLCCICTRVCRCGACSGVGSGGCAGDTLNGDERRIRIDSSVVVPISTVQLPAVHLCRNILQLKRAHIAADDLKRSEFFRGILIGEITVPIRTHKVPDSPDSSFVLGNEPCASARLYSLIGGTFGHLRDCGGGIGSRSGHYDQGLIGVYGSRVIAEAAVNLPSVECFGNNVEGQILRIAVNDLHRGEFFLCGDVVEIPVSIRTYKVPLCPLGVFVFCDELALAVHRYSLTGWTLCNLRKIGRYRSGRRNRCRHRGRCGSGRRKGSRRRDWSWDRSGSGSRSRSWRRSRGRHRNGSRHGSSDQWSGSHIGLFELSQTAGAQCHKHKRQAKEQSQVTFHIRHLAILDF